MLPVIPSVQEIKDRIKADCETALSQTVPALPLAFVKILAGACAGVIYLAYQAVLWTYRQIFPETADIEALIRLGKIFNIIRISAVQTVLLCTVPGTGSQVDAGELFIANTGVIYRVTTTTTITGGHALNVPMIALVSGTVGNLSIGEVLTLVETVLTLTGTATVTSTSVSGADEESETAYRLRVVARYRKRTTGGSPADYYFWGMETPNFDWIGPYADPVTPGNVIIYGHVNNQTDGIPTAGQLVTLEEYLTLDPDTGKAYRKPIGDTLDVNAITVEEFDIEIEIQDSTEDLEDLIEATLIAYLPTLKPYIEGVSDEKKNILSSAGVANIAGDLAADTGANVVGVEITRVSPPEVVTIFTLTGGVFVKVRAISFVDV